MRAAFLATAPLLLLFAFRASRSLAAIPRGGAQSISSAVSTADAAMSSDKPTVSDLVSLPRDEFVSQLGSIYESSPWVAEILFDSDSGPPTDATTVPQLFDAMKAVVDKGSTNQKLELLQSHPDLCKKVEKLAELTEESQTEQSRAGLGSLAKDERAEFLKLNKEYREKFGFPFILAVRNASKYTVLSAIRGRVNSTPEQEFAGALAQVHKIAWMRLLDKVKIVNNKGFLTVHVLDTANGCPAANMRITLHRLSPPESAGLIGEYVTNDDGRLSSGPALKGESFQVGTYEWTFYAGDYFASKPSTYVSGTPFLDEVPIRFGIDDPEEHYHVPLLVSPWSFSTYRGS